MTPKVPALTDKSATAAMKRQAVVDQVFEKQAHYWKSIYERRDLTAITYQQRANRSLQWIRELRLPPGSKVLDAGCGAGITSIALAQNGYRVHAVDHVPAMLHLARESAQEAGVAHLIELGLADISSLAQFSDECFELVLSLGVIGWLELPQQATREMYRILKPGGYLLLSVGNKWALQDVLNPPYNPLFDRLRRKIVPWCRRHGLLSPVEGPPRPPSRRRNSDIDRMLRATGLQKMRSATVGFGPFTFFKIELFPDSISLLLHSRLQSWADRNLPLLRSAGWMYVVLAQKPHGPLQKCS